MRRKPFPGVWVGLLLLLTGVPGRAGEQDSLPREPAAWLGASVREAAADSAGLEITAVDPDGPAANAGLRAGDIVLRVDGITVTGRGDFVRHIQSRHPGDRLRMTVRRADGIEQSLDLALGARRETAAAENGVDRLAGTVPSLSGLQSRPRLGIEIMQLDRDLAAYFRTPRQAAVLVTRVQDLGSGASGGLRTGDVILEVEGHEVRSVHDISDAIDWRADGDRVEMIVWRRETRLTLRVGVESRAAWFGRTRLAAAPQPTSANEELRRELQKLRRDVEELRREVDILRRDRRD